MVHKKKIDKDHKTESIKNNTNKKKLKKEVGGQEGPEPTRFGDWEKKGIASDF
jgi:hypothetical protein|tara:strand:+ start:266 stop:424 length:159 start_codon:yes stop_codon:yes gene_type:complete